MHTYHVTYFLSAECKSNLAHDLNTLKQTTHNAQNQKKILYVIKVFLGGYLTTLYGRITKENVWPNLRYQPGICPE